MSTEVKRALVATVVIAACTLGAKVAGATKDLVLAGVYGVGASLDAFMLAYAIPALLVNVLAGSLNVSFVPRYVAVRASSGGERAARFAASTATILLLGLAAACALLVPIAFWLVPFMAERLPSEQVLHARWMATAMTPLVVLYGLYFFWAGFLNAHGRFAMPAITLAIGPTVIAVSALTLHSTWGIGALVWGVMIGAAIELGLIVYCARQVRGHRLFIRSAVTPDHRLMADQFIPVALGSALLSSTTLVELTFAASTGEGGVSTLGFGAKISQVIAGVFSMAVATAILPGASRMVAEQDWAGLRSGIRFYSIIILVVSIPLSAGIIFFSEDIIRLVFERGAFRSEDSVMVSRVQSIAALQIPFVAWSLLISRMLSAAKANGVLLLGATVSLLINILLNFALVPRFGVVGTAMATSLMYASACVFLGTSFFVRLKRLEGG